MAVKLYLSIEGVLLHRVNRQKRKNRGFEAMPYALEFLTEPTRGPSHQRDPPLERKQIRHGQAPKIYHKGTEKKLPERPTTKAQKHEKRFWRAKRPKMLFRCL